MKEAMLVQQVCIRLSCKRLYFLEVTLVFSMAFNKMIDWHDFQVVDRKKYYEWLFIFTSTEQEAQFFNGVFTKMLLIKKIN